MVQVKRICAFCDEEYQVDIHKTTSFVECCSDVCIEHYFMATAGGVNPLDSVKQGYKKPSIHKSGDVLVQEYRKKLDLKYRQPRAEGLIEWWKLDQDNVIKLFKDNGVIK